MDIMTINYRGRNINIDKNLYEKHKTLKARAIDKYDIDQYLLNEADKTKLKSKWPDYSPEEVMQQFDDKEIADNINAYLHLEIRALEIGL